MELFATYWSRIWLPQNFTVVKFLRDPSSRFCVLAKYHSAFRILLRRKIVKPQCFHIGVLLFFTPVAGFEPATWGLHLS